MKYTSRHALRHHDIFHPLNNISIVGNFPTNKTHMQYDTMLEYMRKRASQVNTTVPDSTSHPC